MIVLRIPRGRRTIALGLLTVSIAGAVLFEARRARAAAPTTSPATELASLRQQRIDTLGTAADTARQMYNPGLLDFSEVLRIDRFLLEAQLESAATDNARVELLKKALAVMRQQEALLSQRERAGTATSLATLV